MIKVTDCERIRPIVRLNDFRGCCRLSDTFTIRAKTIFKDGGEQALQHDLEAGGHNCRNSGRSDAALSSKSSSRSQPSAQLLFVADDRGGDFAVSQSVQTCSNQRMGVLVKCQMIGVEQIKRHRYSAFGSESTSAR